MDACHIVPIGPASIGKTTLVCSVVSAMLDCIAKSGVKTLAAELNAADRPRLEARMAELKRTAGPLPEQLVTPTAAAGTYRVAVGARSSGLFGRMLGHVNMPLIFHDYPGDLCDDLPRFTREVVHLLQSEVLLVPVDATLLMEASNPQEEGAAQALHHLAVVEELIVEWEKGRADAGRGLVIFAPMRCERFFSDNGMQAAPGEAERLTDLVINRHFLNVIDIVRFFGNGLQCFYIPVDTLGSCTLTDKAWVSRGDYAFQPRFAMTGPSRPFGCEMIALIILEYCLNVARMGGSNRALDEMAANLESIIDRFRNESGYQRALRL